MAKRSLFVLQAKKVAGPKIDERTSWYQNNSYPFLTIREGIGYNKAALGSFPQCGFFCDKYNLNPITLVSEYLKKERKR